jgi:signal transduction histidine kinase
MTATRRPDHGFEKLEQREKQVMRLMPYGALIVGTGLALASDNAFPASIPVTLAIAAAAALWMLWMVTLHPEWGKRPGLMAVYYLGLLALVAVLVARNPLYGFFAFVGYLHAALLPGRWKFAGLVSTALMIAGSQSGGFPGMRGSTWPVYLVLAAVNVALAGTFSYFGLRVDHQNQQRKRMIADLADANDRLTATMAENTALHAQLLHQAREAGIADERTRMAREIHDTLAQGLTGIVTQLQAAEQAAGRPAEWQRHVRTAAGLARESLTEARRSVRAIQPSALEGTPLPEALGEVVKRWEELHEVPVSLTTTGTVRPMHPEIELTLLRTAQEALANVAKHAGASRVGLTLSYMGDELTLDVRDDGAGFDPEALPPPNGHGGYGLTAMRQRVARLAGSLAVESEPGGGTAISATVPAVLAEGDRWPTRSGC